MVNHMRTLWINATAAQQLPYSSVYVTPDFAPVTLTSQLELADSILFPRDLESRIALADDLCKICESGELVTYMHTFDTRSTLPHVKSTLVDLIRTASPSVLNMVLHRVGNYPGTTGPGKTLFTWAAKQSDLDTLFAVWTHPSEGLGRVGALALAYAYQLEALRTGGING